MRFVALAVDYDGTIATKGAVDDATREALERARASGRRVILATGRRIDDLRTVFPHLEVFDRIVAENGAVLARPSTREEIPLAGAPPPAFGHALREAGVEPLEVGRVVVATRTPHEGTVLRIIRELGLDLQIIFNKGAVMVLPAGVSKASGVEAALADLGLSPHNVVAVGDAENDLAFLSLCECGVAVQNALAAVKQRADFITAGDHGAGVQEIVDRLVEDDLASLEPDLTRHLIPIGTKPDGAPFCLAPYGAPVLVAGPPGSGKSSLATALLEDFHERGYQFCIIDPEGDYGAIETAVSLGDPHHAPTVDEVLAVLSSPGESVAVNLLAVPLDERPAFFESLMPRLAALREKTGRPHFVVVDEAHHLVPARRRPDARAFVEGGLVFVTVHPDLLSPRAVDGVGWVLAVGARSGDTLARAATLLVTAEPPAVADDLDDLDDREAWAWAGGAEAPLRIHLRPARSERLRHRRKYAEGDLGPDESFSPGPRK